MATRKSSIHHHMKQRTANRSEYDDTLLRHNQRQENRLLLEIEQWEKAQRVVAKGLDKESQWFRQKNPLPGVGQQRSKRNSLSDNNNGVPNLIPDYQFRNRANFVTESHSTADQHHHQHHANGDRDTAEHSPRLDRQPKNHAYGKSSKTAMPDEEASIKDSTKQEIRKRSSQTQRKFSRHQSRERGPQNDGDQDNESSLRKTSSDSTSGGVDKKTFPKTAADMALSGGQDAQFVDKKRQTTASKQNRKPSAGNSNTSSCPPNSASITTTPITTTTINPESKATTNTTTTINTTITPTTTLTTSAVSKLAGDLSLAALATPIPFNPTLDSIDVNDDDNDVTDGKSTDVLRSLRREMTWDGRRRYNNVWDSLSTPKHTSNVRSVRDRLQREFTHIPVNGVHGFRNPSAFSKRSSRT